MPTKLRIPKDMRGVSFPRLLSIELNDFDIDLILPALFFAILSDGRSRARLPNDPTALARYVDALAHHPSLRGFDDADGRRVLDRLVRTSLVTMGRVGRAGRGQQILAVTPYSVLTHKTGLPTQVRRQRGVDTFVYRILRDRLGSQDNLRAFVVQVFGSGVKLGPLPALDGTYDGHTPLDTLTRLCLAFLDGFAPTPVGSRKADLCAPACPDLANAFAEDLLRYLFTYHTRMPVQALTYYLLSLINLELFTYTVKLVHAVNALVRDPMALPPAMRETTVVSPPQLYLDFTNVAGSLSQEMANACVRRDIEAYQQFLTSALLLRQLDRYVTELRKSPKRPSQLDELVPADAKGPEYLQGLLLAQNDPAVGMRLAAAAMRDEVLIRQENSAPDGKPGNDDDGDMEHDLSWLDAIAATGITEVDRVVALLVEGQRSDALKRYVAWYWGTGGLTKPHGILAGDIRGRRAWRYAPGNDFLAVLVQLAAVCVDASPGSGPQQPQPIRLTDFLAFLQTRFGVLVDRPPAPFTGADCAAAARDNLRAMLGRLRQMGIFRDLSDDFTVQRLLPPYVEEGALELGA